MTASQTPPQSPHPDETDAILDAQASPAPETPAPETPASSGDPLADAQAALAELKATNADLADQFLRAKAETENARRRADEDFGD